MATTALKLTAAVAVCLVLVLSAGQPAAAFTACGDCLEECGFLCIKYQDLFCNSVCYKASITPSCDEDCQHTTCQNCKNLAFPECGAKCANGCNGGGVCPPS